MKNESLMDKPRLKCEPPPPPPPPIIEESRVDVLVAVLVDILPGLLTVIDNPGTERNESDPSCSRGVANKEAKSAAKIDQLISQYL